MLISSVAIILILSTVTFLVKLLPDKLQRDDKARVDTELLRARFDEQASLPLITVIEAEELLERAIALASEKKGWEEYAKFDDVDRWRTIQTLVTQPHTYARMLEACEDAKKPTPKKATWQTEYDRGTLDAEYQWQKRRDLRQLGWSYDEIERAMNSSAKFMGYDVRRTTLDRRSDTYYVELVNGRTIHVSKEFWKEYGAETWPLT